MNDFSPATQEDITEHVYGEIIHDQLRDIEEYDGPTELDEIRASEGIN